MVQGPKRLRLGLAVASLAAVVAVGALLFSLASGTVERTEITEDVRPAAGQRTGGVFYPETFTLENGLEVVVISNHRAPLVTQMLWYKVGAADEPLGKSGIAHFLEHLMFKGTDSVPAGEFSRIISRHGGRYNAFTGQDYTAYFSSVARDQLELVMELEADRMTNLRLTDEVFLPEKEVILEERRQSTDNDPRALLNEGIHAALYVNHPYGVPIIGWEHEIRGLTTRDALDFYRKYYTPNNAILVVSGDITAAELRPLTEKYFGSIPPRRIVERWRPEEPPQRTAHRVALRSGLVRQPAWSRSYHAPSFAGGDARSVYALDVVAEILGGGTTSRLYRSLVVGKGVAAAAGAYYDGDNLDHGLFAVYAVPRPGVDLGRIETAMEEVIGKLLEDGVEEIELEKAKKRLIASAVYARDSLFNPARIVGSALATGHSIEDVESWPARIAEVSAGDVLAAARAVLRDDISVTGVLLPEAASESGA